MSKRWLSGVFIIFVLGCVTLVTNATAQEPPANTGELEDGLTFINTERESTLVNTGKHIYLVMVQREPGTAPADESVSFNGKTVLISGVGLVRAVAYQLKPIAVLKNQLWRTCAMGDCSFIGPLPPPPPPTDQPPPELEFVLQEY